MKDSQLHAHVVVKTSNLVISRCRYAKGPPKYLLASVRHVQHDYLWSFNEWYHCFVALLLPSLSSFLKLPYFFLRSSYGAGLFLSKTNTLLDKAALTYAEALEEQTAGVPQLETCTMDPEDVWLKISIYIHSSKLFYT